MTLVHENIKGRTEEGARAFPLERTDRIPSGFNPQVKPLILHGDWRIALDESVGRRRGLDVVFLLGDHDDRRLADCKTRQLRGRLSNWNVPAHFPHQRKALV